MLSTLGITNDRGAGLTEEIQSEAESKDGSLSSGGVWLIVGIIVIVFIIRSRKDGNK